jgi:hypothetical protein
MVVTPQTRPPALATRGDAPFPPRLPLPLPAWSEVVRGVSVVIPGSEIEGVVNGGGVNTAVGTITGVAVVGTTAGVLISSPGSISGESKEDDGWVRRET